MANIAKFANRNILESLAAAVEVLVNFDGGFLHDRMCVVRSTQQRKIVAAGNPLMSIFGIKGQAKQGGLSIWF